MNCEKCQDLIGDFLDGALSQEDQSTLNLHLEECLSCADVRNDLQVDRQLLLAPSAANTRRLQMRRRSGCASAT